jgi:peptidoglycan/LPS O-acetylase OafA/YrhL
MSLVDGFAEPGFRDKGGIAVEQAPAPAQARVRLAYLDGLRALAAAYVVAFHAVLGFYGSDLNGPFRILRRVFAYGHESVAVFIVLSGYCLMLPVVRSDAQALPLDFRRFVQRRARRILPPYFATVAGSLLLIALVPVLQQRSGTTWDDSLPGLDWGAVATHLLVVHNWFPRWGVQINGPLWSVATEWQIYFFFPLLLLPVWRRSGMVGALIAATVVGYSPLAFARGPAWLAIPWYLLLFAFGMAAAAIGFAQRPLEQRLRQSANWARLSGLLWLTCLLLSNAAAGLWFGLKPLSDLLVGLATATLLLNLTGKAAASATSVGFLRLLESKPLVGLGNFSYSLYLTHLPVLALGYFALKPLDLPAPAAAFALLTFGGGASLAFAYVFHVGVERRFMLQR